MDADRTQGPDSPEDRTFRRSMARAGLGLGLTVAGAVVGALRALPAARVIVAVGFTVVGIVLMWTSARAIEHLPRRRR